MRLRTPWLFALACACASPSAYAHISLEQGGTYLSRDGDANLKAGPCGTAGSVRGTNVYTFEPGQTITVNLVETIPHPSYFRIAFDDDGDDDFVDPRSIAPIDPNRACPFNAADKCGQSDFFNNQTVLMDQLDPHIPTAFVTTPFSWQVTLPDVTCSNCTLQVIQVMEDVIHGAYNPIEGDPNDVPYIADVYHQCIDLELVGPPAPADNARSSDSGGCSMTHTSAPRAPAPTWLAALGLAGALLRLRRARSGASR